MRRYFRTLLALVVLIGVPVHASASPVLLDPIIGVRGLTLGESASMPDPSLQSFITPCNAALSLPATYACSEYKITPPYAGGIFSVDLTFTDYGTPIPNNLLTLDLANSDFQTMVALDGPTGFTVRLSMGSATLNRLGCPTPGGPVACTVGNDAVVFILGEPGSGPFQVAMVGINGVSTVPEPGTMLLMGTGLAAMVRRRMRRTAQ